LWGLDAALKQAVPDIESGIQNFKAVHLKLQEFAALPKRDFTTVGFADIFKMVQNFIDRLKVSWTELETKNRIEYQKLENTILATAPLKIIWASPEECLSDALNLWKLKAKSHKGHAKLWSDEEKLSVVRTLFQLFDTDGGGEIDASELQTSLRGLGLICEDDSAQSVVRMFGNKDGVLTLDDFAKLITARIDFVFRLFVKDINQKPEPMIRADDIQRVAAKYCEDLSHEEAEGMIDFLDIDDHQVSKEEFQQLILMPQDEMGRLEALNNATTTARGRTAAGQRTSFHESSMARVTQGPRTSVQVSAEGTPRSSLRSSLCNG